MGNQNKTRSGSIRDLPATVRVLLFLGYLAAGAALLWMLGSTLLSGTEQEDGRADNAAYSEECNGEESGSDVSVLPGNEDASEAPAQTASISEDWSCTSGEQLTLTAIGADGSTLWSYTAQCGNRISANGSYFRTLEWMQNGNIVYINDASAEVMTALDRNTGEVLWQLSGAFGCPIVYDFGSDGTLYIGSANEFYGPACVAVSADGTELWRVTRYFTTYDITAYEDHIRVDFDDWGYTYSVSFDLNGNEI